MGEPQREGQSTVRVINLASAPGERASWDRPTWYVYAWSLAELLLVTNPLQISSGLRIAVLRLFGASIGDGVIFRPRTRVKFPWKLRIGERSWIGEGVWIHNQDDVYIANDVVISQETILTTGSHSHRKDMGLVTSAISIEEGTWITTRCMIQGGSQLGVSCLVTPLTVVRGSFPANSIISGNPGAIVGQRFE
jgi:putative colanic acid biosynthesis acetyltransferase WcaF